MHAYFLWLFDQLIRRGLYVNYATRYLPLFGIMCHLLRCKLFGWGDNGVAKDFVQWNNDMADFLISSILELLLFGLAACVMLERYLTEGMLQKISDEWEYPDDLVPNGDDEVSVTQSLEDPELGTSEENSRQGHDARRISLDDIEVSVDG